MSGRAEKRNRPVSIAMRREMHAFERQVRDQLAERRQQISNRRLQRVLLALVFALGLVGTVALFR